MQLVIMGDDIMKPKPTFIKQKLSIYKTNFGLLENEFKDIISQIQSWDQTGMSSDSAVERKTYIFTDGSSLSITEHFTRDGFISYFNYDWYGKDKKILKKYHSEPHKNKKYQTETEPYHIHRVDLLEQQIREPNYNLRELYEILEEIAEQIE